MRRLYLSIIFSVFGLSVGYSQTATNCTQTIRQIRLTYEQGRLHELPDLAKGCLRNGFTKEEKREAYRYLTLAYIYLEEPDSADINMLKLLETDHFYQVNQTIDPAEFIRYIKSSGMIRFSDGVSSLAVTQRCQQPWSTTMSAAPEAAPVNMDSVETFKLR